MAWIPDHLRDLQADFRAIYHLSWADAVELPGPEFFGLAYRAGAYQGVMAARIGELEQERTRHTPSGARVVPGTRAGIRSDPLLAGVVDLR